MSETVMDEIPGSMDQTVEEVDVRREDEENWSDRNDPADNEEEMDGPAVPSIEEITTQEIDAREKPAALFLGDVDDSDDDDDIQVTIGNYEPEVSTFQNNRAKNRQMLPSSPMLAPKSGPIRGVDIDAQGMINGQPIYEHDIGNAYKDDEKPWKKPGADISDYFNYGFTEETWAQYSDRQRRLRAENNIARLNIGHMPPMAHMMSGPPPMGHPMMMMNRPMHMLPMQRPMNFRKPDGKIGVIGTTDQNSRRTVFEPANNFEHPSFINGSSFHAGQPANGQTVGDLISNPSASNGHQPTHGTPPNGSHHIQTLATHRLPLISLPPGMQFRPQFAHPHGPGRPQFFPRGPMAGMHGDRPPQPYFTPHHPQQSWDKTAAIPMHGFHPGPFPPQITASATSDNTRGASSRSATPENHSSRSATPEENRANTSASGENDRTSKDARYKERYRDDREHHSSSRRSSASYRSHHRSSEHEYERPRNDRKSSRDRDEKYERYSEKRHHRDESDHHRSSHRTPTKTNPSSSESSQAINEQSEPVTTLNPSHGDDAERSSSRHSHHKKSSKRSRHDSGEERSSSSRRYHRRSKDRSSHSKRKSSEPASDIKEASND